MAFNLQLSVAVRNARLDSCESTPGTAAILRIFTGSQPADCSLADAGTKLVEMTLPSDWMNNAASGIKTILGTWSALAVATGTAGYFRLYNSAGTVCHIQGTCGTSGTDMTLDNTSIATNQACTVTGFTLTDANA